MVGDTAVVMRFGLPFAGHMDDDDRDSVDYLSFISDPLSYSTYYQLIVMCKKCLEISPNP